VQHGAHHGPPDPVADGGVARHRVDSRFPSVRELNAVLLPLPEDPCGPAAYCSRLCSQAAQALPAAVGWVLRLVACAQLVRAGTYVRAVLKSKLWRKGKKGMEEPRGAEDGTRVQWGHVRVSRQSVGPSIAHVGVLVRLY